MEAMAANKRQVGGNHYAQGGDFQHWDLISQNNIGYLEGCATKYIARHRQKNGRQDLEKAAHYVQKLREGSMLHELRPRGYASDIDLDRFFSANTGLGPLERRCIRFLCGNWTDYTLNTVSEDLQKLIQDHYGQETV